MLMPYLMNANLKVPQLLRYRALNMLSYKALSDLGDNVLSVLKSTSLIWLMVIRTLYYPI